MDILLGVIKGIISILIAFVIAMEITYQLQVRELKKSHKMLDRAEGRKK